MGWPLLREELALHPGPLLPDGQPSWTLHDPVRNLFFRLDWLTFEILSHWSLQDTGTIARTIAEQTTLHPDPEDVEAVVSFLVENQLTVPDHATGSAGFAERLRRTKESAWKWMLHHYLFFRVPLVRPDRWLTRWVGRIEFLYSKNFFRLTLAALLLGLVEIYRDWSHFSATLVDTLTWQGLAGYGVTLTVVKVLHELGHAFTAKRYGCRVPAMGIAFLVMWPVAYTDTNEVWRLTSRQQRLAVAASGVATELAIAAWATLAWGLLPEGLPRSIAFMLATSLWVATVAINASPFMRFDGYFLLSDWLDMPNLHARAFALARWDLRERLFALGEPVPESFAPRRKRGLILFAWATWIYRLALFIGIAALVYHFFIKAVGIMLFAVEIGWFVLLPIGRELKEWRVRWPTLRESRRARRSAGWAAAFLFLFVVPWPSRIVDTGLLRPAELFPVHAPGGAQVVAIPVANGALVASGDIVIELASPDILRRWERATARIEASRWLAASAGIDSEQRNNLQVLQEERATAEAELASVRADMEPYSPRAPFSGRLMDLDPDLGPGTWVARNERLAVLVRDGRWLVETYLDEEAVHRVTVGDGALFISDSIAGPAISLHVTAIDRDATRLLPDGLLTTAAGGGVVARTRQGQHLPERPVYKVTLEAESDPGNLRGHAWRGRVVIRGTWEAPGERFLRAAVALLWREFGF